MTASKEMSTKIIIKDGSELTESEIAQIKEAVQREFKVGFNSDDHDSDKLFFLLKNEDEILSMGALWEVKPVIFDGENFTIHAFLNVISNIKSKGYGKQVISTMLDYLKEHNFTGFGFTMLKNTGFYEKCGFDIESGSTQRFVYTKDGERITNQDGQVIFFLDNSDEFMKKVIANPDQQVTIPTDKLW